MNNNRFQLASSYQLQGDQPTAHRKLLESLSAGRPHQVLLGVTGSGKTFTMANLIASLNRPALIISPNKTLAGQLYNEFRELFPRNSVEYFVSYYDYYQPEAYVPATDTFIEKDSSINDRIDRLRHSATTGILERRDCIVVASVSCIYGLGSPDTYRQLALHLHTGQHLDRDDLLRQLLAIRYERNDMELIRGHFRVRGDTVEIITASSEARSIRVSFFDDEIESLVIADPLTGQSLDTPDKVTLYPANHYATTQRILDSALGEIETELEARLQVLKKENKLLEMQRLGQRTRFDLEMIRETGFCSGIENYSRYLDRRQPGEPPHVLLDYFPKDFLIFIDESHITVPQIRGMFAGDRSRKQTLVDYGFRLPSALDNRPLNFDEFNARIGQAIYVSATPGDYEQELARDAIVEQIIRPTGLLDPVITIRPTTRQVDDLAGEIRKTVKKGERVLVTTLTKRMAEKLCDYYAEQGMMVRYLHSDIQTMERMKILQDLRKGVFSVLIGINLLREGLDLPEVSLVGILEADQEGFLRSRRSLIQIFGRAARNAGGRVILYADRKTRSIREAVDECNRRRRIQEAYNQKHGITPATILKASDSQLVTLCEKDYLDPLKIFPQRGNALSGLGRGRKFSKSAILKEIAKKRRQMMQAAKKFHFEEAASLRDEMFELEKIIESLW